MRHSILNTSANEPDGPSISMPTQWRSTRVCPRIHSSHRSSLGSRGSVSPAPSTASSSSSARSSDSRYPSRGRERRWAGSSREQGPLSSDPTERSPTCSRPRSRSPSCRPRRSGCRAHGPRPIRRVAALVASDGHLDLSGQGPREATLATLARSPGDRAVDPRLRRDAGSPRSRRIHRRRPRGPEGLRALGLPSTPGRSLSERGAMATLPRLRRDAPLARAPGLVRRHREIPTVPDVPSDR